MAQVAQVATGSILSIHTSSNNDDVIVVKVLALNRSISSNGLPHFPKILLDRASFLLLRAAPRPSDADDHDGAEGDCEQRDCGDNSHAVAKTCVSTRILDDSRDEGGHGFGP